MKYYSHHIGDFDKATRHLTRLERSVYRDLLDQYFITEKPLMLDVVELCRKIIARSNEESTAVEQVLNEFFVKTPIGWYNDRCEEEIDRFKASTTQKSVAGRASAAKKALKRQRALDGNSTPVEQALNAGSTEDQQDDNGTPTNHYPLSSNHDPSSIKSKSSDKPLDGNFERAWSEYPKRPGASKADSLKAWNARLKAGVDPDEMLAGVARYSRYVVVAKTEPQFIKQPATFFGPGEHYKSDWTPQNGPPAKPEKFDPSAYVNQKGIMRNERATERTIEFDEHGQPV